MTIAEIYDMPIDRQREAIRDWHAHTSASLSEMGGGSGVSQRPADDVIDGYLNAERIRRELVGYQAVAA